MVPSCSPSLSPTIEACAQASHRVVGSDLIKLTSASTWDDTADELTLVVELPYKYNLQQIAFEDPSGTSSTLSYDSGTQTDTWTYEYQTERCMHVFNTTIGWDDVVGYTSVTSESDRRRLQDVTYFYTGVVRVTATETFNHDVLTTQTYTRTVVEDLVFVLGIENTVSLSVDFDVSINNASTYQVFDRLSVLEHDGSDSGVTIEYVTEVNYPWILNPTSYDFVNETDGIPYIAETSNLTELERGADCGVSGETCVQVWRMQFDVNAVCDVLGRWTVRHYATYESESQSFDFSAIVSLDSSCAETFTNVVTQATLTSYTAEDLATAADTFSVGDTVYFRVIVDEELRSISNITMESVSLIQNIGGVQETRNQTALNYNYLSSSAPENRHIDFSLDLVTDLVKMGEDAIIRATVTVDYEDRRQLLTVGSNGNQFYLVESVPRRAILYVDMDNNIKVNHVITIKQHVAECIKDGVTGETSKINEIYQFPCEGQPEKSHTQRCTESGWETIFNACAPLLEESQTSESLNTESQSDGDKWEIIFFVLLSILLIGSACLAYRMLRGKDEILFTQGPMQNSKILILEQSADGSKF